VDAGCAPVIAVDLQPPRLELALELGATHVVDSRQTDPIAEIRRITTDGVDVALDTTGQAQIIAAAVDALAVRGRCGTVGLAPPDTVVPVTMGALIGGRSLRGILLGDAVPRTFIPHLIALHLAGRFPFDRLCEVFPFDQINQASRSALDGSVLKPVLRMP
jgi:aryl-alcohol dehydrogenase